MLESEIQKMSPDMEAIELYRQKAADYTARMAELEAATAERDEVGGWDALGRRGGWLGRTRETTWRAVAGSEPAAAVRNNV